MWFRIVRGLPPTTEVIGRFFVVVPFDSAHRENTFLVGLIFPTFLVVLWWWFFFSFCQDNSWSAMSVFFVELGDGGFFGLKEAE